VNLWVPMATRAWIAILALALLTASLQAKLGLYRPGKSRDQFISKEFKPAECRRERVQAKVPVVCLSAIVSVVNCQGWRAEPRSPEPEPATTRPVPISPSHWYRPPPYLS
jgi:hypothetical protein